MMHASLMCLVSAVSALVVVGSPPEQKGDTTKPQTLEFRVVAEKGDAVDPVAKLPVEQYRKQLAEHGVNAKPNAACVWKRVRDPERFFGVRDARELADFNAVEVKESMVLGQRGGDYYVLVLNSDDNKMVRSAGGTPEWSLQDVHLSAEKERGSYRVFCGLDETGAARLQALTKNNIGRHLAICLGDDIVTAPKVMEPVGKEFVVVGSYSEGDLEPLVDELQVFVPKHDWSAGPPGKGEQGDGQPGDADKGDSQPDND